MFYHFVWTDFYRTAGNHSLGHPVQQILVQLRPVSYIPTLELASKPRGVALCKAEIEFSTGMEQIHIPHVQRHGPRDYPPNHQ